MKYNLFGVSNHLMFKSVGGHYTSYIAIDPRKEGDDMGKTIKEQWFEFDDESVEPISSDKVVNKEAFLLFFK